MPFFVPLQRKKDKEMALAEDLQIYRQMYQLLGLILDAREHFPKSYKYAFGERMMMVALECCELIQAANMSQARRASLLEDFSIKFGSLQLMLRLCRDRHIVDEGRFCNMLALAGEIGKQATAWRKSATFRSQSPG